MAKIIAATATGFLVDMNQTEVANLLGYSYASDLRRVGMLEPSPGLEINVHPMWQRLSALKECQRTLDGMAAELHRTANWLKSVPAIVEAQAPILPLPKAAE